MRDNTQGRARRALAPHPRLRALLQRAARHHHRSVPCDLQGRRAAPAAREGAVMTQGLRTAVRRPHRSHTRAAFTFDGRHYQGFAGDTLASALLANGVHLIGRSFKYHRPRGMLAAGAEEPNALVTVRRDAARETPNLRATQVELYEGLSADSQNRWPSLALRCRRDQRPAVAPFIPAGFYYKTFMWPRARVERAVRAAHPRRRGPRASAPQRADPDRYAHAFRALRRARRGRRPRRACRGGGRRGRRRARDPVRRAGRGRRLAAG